MDEKEKELFPSPHGVTVIKSFNEVVLHIVGCVSVPLWGKKNAGTTKKLLSRRW